MTDADGPPPFGFPSSTGTWDDWLVMRGSPKRPAGERDVDATMADFVAIAIGSGNTELLDFGLAPFRNGLRDLFAEFEASTAGHLVQPRQMAPQSADVDMLVMRAPADRVRVSMIQDGGLTLTVDWGVDEAVDLAARLVSVITSIKKDPGGA